MSSKQASPNHESEQSSFKSLALRLVEQVAHLTKLVADMQSRLNSLQSENRLLSSQQQDHLKGLIQPAPIQLFSSSPSPDLNHQDLDQSDSLIEEINNVDIDFDTFASEMDYFKEITCCSNSYSERLLTLESSSSSSPKNIFKPDANSPMMGYQDAFMDISPDQQQDQFDFLLSSFLTPESSKKSIPFPPQNSRVPSLKSTALIPTFATKHVKKPTRKHHGPLKILIVEDDPLCQQLISHIITSLQVGQCEIVADGIEAVINMSTNTFDLILMDMHLPRLDGLQATQNIRKFNRRTPIVSMTARVDEDDIRRYFEGGIDDVLPKPFDKQSVRKIIETFYKLSLNDDQTTS